MNKYKNIIFMVISVIFVLFLFLRTMNPVFIPDDSPETILASSSLGVQHAPGYPLYAVLGKIFISFLPGNPGFRMNLLSSLLCIILSVIFIFTVKLISRKTGAKDDYIFFITLSLFLSLGYIFWNQATTAKGGIFMLNLIFIALLLLTGMKTELHFIPSNLYFFAFIAGLSLANHWASILYLLPFLAIPFFRIKNRINFKNFMAAFIFFIIGLTPYLYIFIRGRASPLLNYGRVESFGDFIWMVTRQAYEYPSFFNPKIAFYQFKESLNFISLQFSLAVFLIISGFIYIKKSGFLKSYYTIIISFVLSYCIAVLYNQVNKDALWLMHIYLMPFSYFSLLIISTALIYLKNSFSKTILYSLILPCLILVFAGSYSMNNKNNNYFIYDFGNNIAVNTGNNIYIAEYDTDSMPFYYFQDIQKKHTGTIKVIPYFLNYEWGRKNFKERYGIELKTKDSLESVKQIIKIGQDNNIRIFKSIRTKDFDDYSSFSSLTVNGIINEINSRNYPDFNIALLNLRGLFDKRAYKIRRNINPDYYIAIRYPVFLVNYGNRLLENKMYLQALKCYKTALALSQSEEIPKNIILHNITLAKNGLNK